MHYTNNLYVVNPVKNFVRVYHRVLPYTSCNVIVPLWLFCCTVCALVLNMNNGKVFFV